MVENVNALLNQLTVENFDSISDQVISWANKSENEKDARALFRLAGLVFEKSMDEATSEMYARLCRQLREQISPKVRDDGFKDREGKPYPAGQLFRKFLLDRCQEEFERGWTANLNASEGGKNISRENEKKPFSSSNEDHAAQKAERRHIGLIKFMGELFKVQMVSERVMHECAKKLLSNADPTEDDIESLCKIFTEVGSILDTGRARAHIDVYMSRMKGYTKNPRVAFRLQLMLQDVIELRERNWMAIIRQLTPS